MHQQEHQRHAGEPDPVQQEQLRHLVIGHDRHSRARGDLPKEHRPHDEREQELERVHIEEHDKQQEAGQEDPRRVAPLAIAPANDEVLAPVPHQEGEADRKGGQALGGLEQLREGLRHFARENEQSHREGEDAIGQPLQARDLCAAEAEALGVNLTQPFRECAAQHDARLSGFARP